MGPDGDNPVDRLYVGLEGQKPVGAGTLVSIKKHTVLSGLLKGEVGFICFAVFCS